MDETDKLLFSKAANAKIVGSRGKFLAVTKVMDEFFGGAWGGGKLRCDGSSLSFVPNAVNKALHRSNLTIEIDVADIVPVEATRGPIGPVVVQPEHREARFRVYGAKRISEKLRALVDSHA